MKGSRFVRNFFQTEMIGLGFGVPVATAYVLLLLDIEPFQVEKILSFVVVIALVVVGGIAMPTNYILSRRIRPLLDTLNDGTIQRQEVYTLYLRSMKLPLLHGELLFARIAGGALVVVGYMAFFLHVEGVKCLMAVVLAVYGSYLAALVSFVATAALIRPIGREIVGKGLLDGDFIEQQKIFGLGVIKRNVLFLIVPMVFTNITVFLSFYSAYISRIPLDQLLGRIIGVLAANIFTLLVSIVLTLLMMRRPINTLKQSLYRFSSAGKDQQESIPTDLSDDFAYISYLMNQALKSFRAILLEVERAASLLSTAVQELSTSSREVSATSNQQAAAVKEIVSTMEDSDQLSRSIAEGIHEVAGIAQRTTEAVEAGEQRVTMSLSKMDEIRDSNSKTIEGIRSLGEKIGSIWDIVNIINGVATQTKIIAFNAELEASAAGEAGKNFQIVATEIRRLADSTVASTTEIRNKINEIQHSSDDVITTSEEGSEIINQGRELSRQLSEVFGGIKTSAATSAGSAGKIEVSVNQQVSAFEQILSTLRQISDGIESFVVSTKMTSASSEQLKEMAESLNQLVKGKAEKEVIGDVRT